MSDASISQHGAYELFAGDVLGATENDPSCRPAGALFVDHRCRRLWVLPPFANSFAGRVNLIERREARAHGSHLSTISSSDWALPAGTVRSCERKHAPMATLYRYSFDKRLIAFWGPFGVRPATDGVTLTDDGRLQATFGFLRLDTPLQNVTGAHITRNYRWWTAAGARRSMKDDGLTFGTNAERRCVHPLPRQGAVAAPPQGPLRADGHRRGSRRVDGSARPPLTPIGGSPRSRSA